MSFEIGHTYIDSVGVFRIVKTAWFYLRVQTFHNSRQDNYAKLCSKMHQYAIFKINHAQSNLLNIFNLVQYSSI